MQPPGGPDERDAKIMSGFPQTPAGELGPLGQVEQSAKIADRLTHLTGWRRSVARWAVIALLTLALVGFIVVNFIT